jgi:multiple sugar transport system substrate-binding protein
LQILKYKAQSKFNLQQKVMNDDKNTTFPANEPPAVAGGTDGQVPPVNQPMPQVPTPQVQELPVAVPQQSPQVVVQPEAATTVSVDPLPPSLAPVNDVSIPSQTTPLAAAPTMVNTTDTSQPVPSPHIDLPVQTPSVSDPNSQTQINTQVLPEVAPAPPPIPVEVPLPVTAAVPPTNTLQSPVSQPVQPAAPQLSPIPEPVSLAGGIPSFHQPQDQAAPQPAVIPQAGPPIPSMSNTMLPPVSPKRTIPKILMIVAGVVLVLLLVLGAVLILRGRSNSQSGLGTKNEIVWWGITTEESTISPLIAEYKQNNPDITVTYIKQSPRDYRERLVNALASGNGPDIYEIHNSWPAMFTPYLSAMPAEVMSKNDYESAFYPIITSDLQTQKGIIAMPLTYDALTMYINQDVFTSAAMEPPKYWSELQTLVEQKKLLQTDPQDKILQSPVAFGTTSNVDHWQEIFALLMFQNNVDFRSFSGTKFDEVFAYHKLYKDAKVWDDTLPESTGAFARNKVAIYFAPLIRAQEIVQTNPSLRFRTVPMLQLEPDDPTDPTYSYATYWAQGVWEQSSDKDNAWQLLKFMSTADSLQKMNAGRVAEGKLPVLTSRPDLNLQYANHPILGSVVGLAKDARSWYLADETYDGATGINSQLAALFSQNLITSDKDIATKIRAILTQFGISSTTK